MDPIIKTNAVEPYLKMMPSFIHNGMRFRTVFNKLHFRPVNETFHEFLIATIKWTLGKAWWQHQQKLEIQNQHPVIQWEGALAEIARPQQTEAPQKSWSIKSNGPGWALITLGYDLYCLQIDGKLPDHVVERLRVNASFQGARYEVAVAAIMAKSGFEIEFFDSTKKRGKHCEFMATCRETGVIIGVEAKSRRRPGVLHAPEFSPSQNEVRGIENLIRDAKKQRIGGHPLLIFIDLNLPDVTDSAWRENIWSVLYKFACSPEHPCVFNALIFTNFAYHYGDAHSPVPESPHCISVPLHPEIPVDSSCLQRVSEVLKRGNQVPKDV